MNQKEIYILIRCWEIDAGEGFIEYFGDNYGGINHDEIMPWLAEKGYITSEKLELFKNTTKKYIGLGDCLQAYEVEYSLFPLGECDEEASFKAELIIAEYIVEKGLEKLLLDFAFEGEGWASFDNEEHKEAHKQGLQKCINNWDDDDYDGYFNVLKLSVDEINERLKKENEEE